MKVYLVSRSQGQYDESRNITMNLWKDKRDAEKYVERCKKIFPKLYEFYNGIFSSEDYEQPLFRVSWDRSNDYEPAVFYIEEFELR